ncbi:MAG: hypothetical protein WAP03_12810 [Methylorubrum rhodinum]|uniref:hypothetical protein n=1 Tax=Methylorubrum rhodinum TaxID=29428 RepID=UPI003BAECEAB
MGMSGAERQARYRELVRARLTGGLREAVNAERRRCLTEWRAEMRADGYEAVTLAAIDALLAKPDRDPEEFEAWFGRVLQSELESELKEARRGARRQA